MTHSVEDIWSEKAGKARKGQMRTNKDKQGQKTTNSVPNVHQKDSLGSIHQVEIFEVLMKIGVENRLITEFHI